MSNMIGVGPFITIPLLMSALGGPQAMLGWLVAALIVIPDGMVWSELGAAMPGSGGTYVYLREGFGRETFGRLMAFLFIWQFILSGPLEIASGYIGFASYARYMWPGLTPAGTMMVAITVGLLNIALLYRQITSIGAITVTLWVGTLLTTLAVIATGAVHFDPAVAFDFPPGRVQLFDRLSAWPRRRGARGCLRLPRLLRHLLHRRRGQRPGPDDPAIDHHQHHRGRPDLRRHQPLGHRRGALAGVRSRRRASGRVVHRVGLHGAHLRIGRRDGVHRDDSLDGVRVGVRAAARLFPHPVRGGARRLFLQGLRPRCTRPSASRTSRWW